MPTDVTVPHALLRFVEHGRYIWFMDTPIYDGLVCQALDVNVPIVRVDGVHAGHNGVRVGYRFSAPRELTRVHPNYVLVAKDSNAVWEPYLGLPGLQFYVADTGVMFASTRITRFFRSLE